NVSTELITAENQAPTADVPYREAVGALMRLMCATRPDIAFAVGMVARYMEAPQDTHWTAVKRIRRDAESVALNLAIQEGKWVHRLLCEILAAPGAEVPKLAIFEDNQSCIKMTKNPVNHGRAKHIDIKYHHIRDEVKSGEVEVEY
ncbi:Integrase catalytic core protein, partial [Globisporangium polare]